MHSLFRNQFALLTLMGVMTFGWQTASSQTDSLSQLPEDHNKSERSDRLTGGRIELADFAPGEPDIRITLNVPSFRLTFWQNGKEVKSYFVGVGM